MIEILGVTISEPGNVTALGYFVKEREKGIWKLECTAYVGWLVENGLPK